MLISSRLKRSLQLRARRVVRRRVTFRRAEDGAVAVEFAIVALPFFMLLFGTLEVALILFTSEVLETATHDAARLIMTGQVQAGNMPKADYKTEVCKRIPALVRCDDVKFDINSDPELANLNMAIPVDAKGNVDASKLSYNPGKDGDYVIARVFYEMPLHAASLMPGLTTADGKRRIMAVAVFRNQ